MPHFVLLERGAMRDWIGVRIRGNQDARFVETCADGRCARNRDRADRDGRVQQVLDRVREKDVLTGRRGDQGSPGFFATLKYDRVAGSVGRRRTANSEAELDARG